MRSTLTILLLSLAAVMGATPLGVPWAGASPPAEGGGSGAPAAAAPVAPPAVRADVRPWPHMTSDLAPDPAFRFDALDHGLRVAWRDHPVPPGQVRLALHLAVGSLAEDARTRGAVHLLEHLAFQGGRRLSRDPLVSWLDAQGLPWGPHAASSSSWRDLVIEVSAGSADLADLRTALAFLADVADGLPLDADSVSAARAAIEEEVAGWSQDVQRRALRETTARLLAGSRLAETLPMGDEAAVDPADLRAFRSRWLRPDLMTLLVVGDLGGQDPMPLVRDVFGGLAPARGARPELPEAGTPSLAEPFFCVTVPELSQVQVTLGRVRPGSEPVPSRSDLLAEVPLSLARGMLMVRMRTQAERGRWPVEGVSVGPLEAGDVLQGESLTLLGPAGSWDLGLSLCALELRRVLENGFTQEELELIRGDALTGLQDAAVSSTRRTSQRVMGDLLAAASGNDVPTAPAADLGLLSPAVAVVDEAACREALRTAWAAGRLSIRAVGPEPITPLQLRAAYDNAVDVPLDGLPRQVTFAYASSPDLTGEVASRKQVPDLDLTQVRLGNGVRLNIKRTSYEPGTVMLRAVVGEGQLALPTERSAVAFGANQLGALQSMGTQAHSVDELELITGDRMSTVRLTANEDVFTFDTMTTPDDVLLALEVLTARIGAPGFRGEAFELRRRQVDSLYADLGQQMRGPILTGFLPALFGGDGRFGLPPLDQARAVTLDDIVAWVGPQFEAAPVEVTVLGDVDVDRVVQAAQRTLALLPPRRAPLPWSDRRQVSLVSGLAWERQVAEPADLDLVQLHFPTPDGSVARRRRALSLLSVLVGERLQRRFEAELGASPDLGVTSSASQVFEGLGDLLVEVVPPRGSGRRVVDLVLDEVARLATGGLDVGELEAVRGPQLERIREQMDSNGFWLGVLSRSQRQPERLDQARDLLSDYETISGDEVQALAREVLVPERASWIVVQGQAPVAGG